MSNILFYGPFNQRSRDNETLMLAFKKQGHNIIFLTQFEGKEIVPFLRSNGINAYSYKTSSSSTFFYFLKHVLYLIRFCRNNKVDIMYSHLEPGNFVSSIAQYFISAKVFICRHHINEGKLYNFDNDLHYKMTYSLAKNIIVVSEHARRYMIHEEKINAQKITHINLSYDFSLYPKPTDLAAKNLRKEFTCSVLLVSLCRLTKYKRPDVAINTLNSLLKRGLNAKLVILGQGEMENELKKQIIKLKLQGKVIMPGYVNNVLEYLHSADYLLHPSLLDSSCVAVKEAGLLKKPVIVCKGVGDFDETINHNVNGFIVSADSFMDEAAEIIFNTRNDKEFLNSIGQTLHDDILRLFSIESILPQYELLNSVRH